MPLVNSETQNVSIAPLIKEIEQEWEVRVRRDIPSSGEQTSFILQNSLHPFLENLFQILSDNDTASARTEQIWLSKQHGGERAQFKGYQMPQLLKEFSILRENINESLKRRDLLSHERRSLIDKTIDTAMSLAADEFTIVQTSDINQSLFEAKTSNAELSHFAAIAAHDLKSPLATISGFAELLKEPEFSKDLSHDGKELLNRISSAAERMRKLIEAMLAYAQIEQPDRNFETVPLTSLVQSAIENLADKVNATKAVISYGNLPSVHCDPPLIAQLFQNLIANSLKFSGQNPPRIDIKCENVGTMWKFSVTDNGIGFDPTKKDEIFKLYKKLHSDQQGSGSGIGLATCKRIVELHGGKIWADSKPNHGSTFYFCLPRGHLH